MSTADANAAHDTPQPTELQPLEPEQLDGQLQSCGLTLFGAGNDCVWTTIAHLLGCTVDDVKQKTGLSPTQGTDGIHAHAVRGLLTSLGRTFYSGDVPPGVQPGGSSLWAENDWLYWLPSHREVSWKKQAIGVCYTRQDGSGHCVVYEPFFDVPDGGKTPVRRYLALSTQSPSSFKFVDYSVRPEVDALSDVRASTVKLVFSIDGGRAGPRMPSRDQAVRAWIETRRQNESKRDVERKKKAREETWRQSRGIGDGMDLDDDDSP